MEIAEIKTLVKLTKLPIGKLEQELGIGQSNLSKILSGSRKLTQDSEQKLKLLAGKLQLEPEIEVGRRFIRLCNEQGVSVNEMFLRITNQPSAEEKAASPVKESPKPKMIFLND